jgi:hypothetical protein
MTKLLPCLSRVITNILRCQLCCINQEILLHPLYIIIIFFGKSNLNFCVLEWEQIFVYIDLALVFFELYHYLSFHLLISGYVIQELHLFCQLTVQY